MVKANISEIVLSISFEEEEYRKFIAETEMLFKKTLNGDKVTAEEIQSIFALKDAIVMSGIY